MKAISSPRIIMFISLLFMLCIDAGCKKSTTEAEVDPGYGCNTSEVLGVATNVPAQLVYMTPAYGTRWYLVVQLPGNNPVICHYCDHEAEIQAILAGHSTNDVLNVTVSGRIKRSMRNQNIWLPNGQYPEFYRISIDAIR